MIPQVTDVKPSGEYKLWLRFSDGVAGTIDLSNELWGPMFEPLKDQSLFNQVAVHPELQTIMWPNGADFAPEFLYQQVTSISRSEVPAINSRV